MKSAANPEFYDDKEGMPLDERQRYYDQRIAYTVDYAYHHAPAIKAKLDEAKVNPKDIRTTKDLEQVPVITKDELKKLQRANPPFGGFITVPLNKLEHIYMAPGPLYEPPTPIEIYARQLWGVGFRPEDIILNTVSYHLVHAGTLVDEAITQLGATVIPSGPGNSESLVQIISEVGVTGYIGTGTFLLNLMKKAKELGHNPKKDFKLKIGWVGIEMIAASLRQELEDEYGIRTVECYGASDVGSFAFECPARCGMHIGEEVFVEIVDSTTGKQLNPGEVGEVVLTALNNEIYPLVRFGSGDLAYHSDEPCACGRTSLRLMKIVGRVGEATKVRGMSLHPSVVGELMQSYPQISRAQVVITQVSYRDKLSANIELKSGGFNKLELSDNIKEGFQKKCQLKLDEVNFVAEMTIPQDSKIVKDERSWK